MPSTIDFVLLTHGHLDHCGWFTRLVNQGFSVEIYCTRPKKDMRKRILLNSALIQEEEVKNGNERKYSKHEIAEPLNTVDRAKKVFPFFRVIKTNEPILLDAQIENCVRMRDIFWLYLMLL